MDNKTPTKYFILRFAIVMITIMFVGNMLAIRNVYIPMRNLQYSLTFACLLWFTLIFISNIELRSKAIVINTFLFMILIATVTFISYYNNSLYTSFNILTKALFWAVTLIAAYGFGYKYDNAIGKSLFITASLPILFFLFVLIKEQLLKSEDIAMITSAYYLLCLLPFVFLLKSTIVKIVFVAFIGTAVLMSSKRTGFIAFALAVLAYLFFDIMLKKETKFKLLRYVAVVCVLAFFLSYIVNQFDFTVLDRLQTLSEDGGSGRTSVYDSAWRLIKQTNLIPFFFGKGYNRVYRDMGLNLSAHTDFLEVLYDYGLIGFALYINMYYILIKYAKRLCKTAKEYAPAFISAIVIMFVLSAFSHLIIFNTYFIYLCFFFGIVMGEYDRKEKERLCKQ